MTAKEEFREIASNYISRCGMPDLLDMLENTDFYTAPASTRFHGSHEGGLVEHSVNVFHALWKMTKETYDAETIAIVALFHDICKMGYYTVEYRNTKDERGNWIKVPYYSVNDRLPFGHGEKSVFMIQDFMKLNLDEAMAIRWHMGLSVDKESYQTMSKAFNEFPLAVYLHMADLEATYVMDKKGTL